MSHSRFRWQGCGWSSGSRATGQRRHQNGNGGWFSHIRLYRNPAEGRVKGVCAGFADYFGLPVLALRVACLIALFVNPFLTVIGYFLLAWLLPERPADLFIDAEEEAFWQQVRKEPLGTVHDLRHRLRTTEQRLRGVEAYVTSPEFELNRELRGL